MQTETIPVIEHEHSYSEEWSSDENNHWHACECGAKADTAAHTYGEWSVTKEATETETGSKERTCTVCAYVQTEAIPAAGTGEPTDSTDPTDSSESQGQQDPSGDTGSPQTGDSSNMMLWISLMLASCGGVLGLIHSSVVQITSDCWSLRLTIHRGRPTQAHSIVRKEGNKR